MRGSQVVRGQQGVWEEGTACKGMAVGLGGSGKKGGREGVKPLTASLTKTNGAGDWAAV